MSPQASTADKWAMIPESVIVGEWLPGISTQRRQSAFLVYCYLDLRQGKNGWPVRGYRTVARATGLQPRTVARAARTLEEVGLIELTVTAPVATSAVMRVIHNPARRRINPAAAVGPPAKRYRHETLLYEPAEIVHDAHESLQGVHLEGVTPDARDATGSRSTRYEWFDDETRDALAEMVSAGLRCPNCLGFVASHRKSGVDPREYCDCPM